MALWISPFPVTGDLDQFHSSGFCPVLEPAEKELSFPLLNSSLIRVVVDPINGTPADESTYPPVPVGPGTQSPIPETV